MVVDGNLIDLTHLPEGLRVLRTVNSADKKRLVSLDELQPRHVLRVLGDAWDTKPKRTDSRVGRATI